MIVQVAAYEYLGALGSLAVALSCLSTADAATYRTIYSFQGDEGYCPDGELLVGGDGTLYGVTSYGGPANHGTVFALKPAWATGSQPAVLTVLHGFTGTTDGSSPRGGLVLGPDGTLYGTTFLGGSGQSGIAFALTPSSGKYTETIIHSFGAYSADAKQPYSGLWRHPDGTLYGTSTGGGSGGAGTIFALLPPSAAGGSWQETIVHSFNSGADGDYPAGRLIAYAGTLYGIASFGGAHNDGTFFSLGSPGGGAGAFSLLYSFGQNYADGSAPYAAVTPDQAGGFYGTTSEGGTAYGGTVFHQMPPSDTSSTWSTKVLADLDSAGIGFYPNTALIYGTGGALYGTLEAGGSGGYGTVFSLSPTTRSNVSLHGFGGDADGVNPSSPLTPAPDGGYYGVACGGGHEGAGRFGYGVIYEVTL